MLNTLFSFLRAPALAKVTYINEMAEAPGLSLREEAFEALGCEILDAFYLYPLLDQVDLVLVRPTLAFDCDSEPGCNKAADLVIRVAHHPFIETKGAIVEEWKADWSAFFSALLPLSKLGAGRLTVDRPMVQPLLDTLSFSSSSEEVLAHYKMTLRMLMARANRSFGQQLLQQVAA